MRQDTGSNRALKIDSHTVTNPESGKSRSIQPLNGLIPVLSFPLTITAPSTSGGSFSITNTSFSGSTPTLTVSVSNYIKIGIAMDALGSITLTFGTEGASVAAATPAAVPDGLIGIGYYVLQNVAGTISNVVNANIYQYGSSGGSGSGSGTASAILETIKNEFTNSPYNLVTPVIAKDDQLTAITTYFGTPSYSIVDKAYKFTASSDAITTVNMIDSLEFGNDFKDIWDVRTELFWKAGSIDPVSTVEVSRDGFDHKATVTQTRVGNNTEVFGADYKWPREEEDLITVSNATGATDTTLNASSQQSLSAKFSFTANTRLTTVTAKLKRLGSTLGSYRFAIYSDNSGVPGTRLYSSNYMLTSTLPTTAANQTWDVDGQGILASLTANVSYHLVIETDSTYQAGFVAATTEIYWVRNNASGTALAYSYNGTAWSVFTTSTFVSAETGGQEFFGLVNEYDVSNATNQIVLNATTEQRISQAFTIATVGTTSSWVVKRVKLYLNQLGTPVGNFTVQIIKDSSGSPSTSYSDIYGMSSSYAANQNGGTGSFTFTAAFPATVLPVGTYHLVLVPDATYATNTFGSNAIRWQTDDTSPPVVGKRFNGTVWSAVSAASNLTYRLEGRKLNLQFRITAGTNSVLLEGMAIYYDKEIVGVSGGTKKIQSFRFQAVANNTSTFAITAFLPDPDLLKVYHAETGQVYTYPAFDMQGYSVVFPTNTFNNGGVETTVTLRFEQTEGSGFDFSERNGNLLASNKLGSSDATLDRSQAGRGIILRNAAGILREISLDANDNLVISTVP